MRNPNEMLNDWNPETASLLASLRAAGFTIRGGSNGEDKVEKPESFANESAFLNELLACDEAWLYVTRKGRKESKKTPGKQVAAVYTLFLVMGNSPGELVSDWGIPADEDDANALELAVRKCSDEWEDRKQPLIAASVKYPNL